MADWMNDIHWQSVGSINDSVTTKSRGFLDPLVVLLSVLAVTATWYVWARNREPGEIRKVEMSVNGSFQIGYYPWEMTIFGDGRGELTVFKPGVQEKRQINVADKLPELNAVIRNSRLGALPSRYGGSVPDGSVRRLSIETANFRRHFEIRYLGPGADGRDLNDVLALWNAFEACCDDPEAAR
ncbi:MAG: hypothetical protein AB7O26_15625 [Planctomycetaceae bacterium]